MSVTPSKLLTHVIPHTRIKLSEAAVPGKIWTSLPPALDKVTASPPNLHAHITQKTGL